MLSRAVRSITLASILAASALAQAQTTLLDEAHTLGDGATVAVAEHALDVTDAGQYKITLTDLAVPAALHSVTLAITQGTTVVTTVAGPGTADVTLQAASYVIRVIGIPSQTTRAGNVGVKLSHTADDSSVLEFVQALVLAPTTVSTDSTLLDTGFTLTAGGSYTLTLTDFSLPQPLATLTAAVMPPGGGSLLVNLNAAGSATFAGAPGDYRLLAAGQAQSGASGTFGVEIRPQAGGVAVLSAVESAGGGSGAAPGLQFKVDIASAGGYRVTLADFQFPGALAQLRLSALQNGTVLGSLDAAGSLDVTAAAGELILLVVAPPGAAGSGLIGLSVAPAAGGAALFETTQGVGNLFDSRQVDVATAGTYRVTLSDVAFPAPFAELAATVTRGAERVGSIYGGGAFDFDATAGSYVVNFVSTPDAAAKAGTYGMKVESVAASAPPPDDPPSPPAQNKGGGGGLDMMSLLALTGATALSRRLRRRRPDRPVLQRALPRRNRFTIARRITAPSSDTSRPPRLKSPVLISP